MGVLPKLINFPENVVAGRGKCGSVATVKTLVIAMIERGVELRRTKSSVTGLTY